MIVKVVEQRLTWKDTCKPHIQYDVYYSTESSEREYRDGKPRSFGPHMVTTKYPFNFCRRFVHVGGELPMTVLRFIMDDSGKVNVTTGYKEYWLSLNGMVKETTYILARCDGGYTKEREAN